MSRTLTARQVLDRWTGPNANFGAQRSAIAAVRASAFGGMLKVTATRAVKCVNVSLSNMTGTPSETFENWPVPPELWLHGASPSPSDVSAWAAGNEVLMTPAAHWRLAGLQFLAHEVERLAPYRTEAASEHAQVAPTHWWILHEAVSYLVLQNADYTGAVLPAIKADRSLGKKAFELRWLAIQRDLPAQEGGLPEAGQDHRVIMAVERLRSSCEQGRVDAIGVPPDNGTARPIPASAFIGAELWHGPELSLHRNVAGQAEPPSWLEVRFNSGQVRALVDGKPPSSSSKPSSSKSPSSPPVSEAEWTRWVNAYCKKHPVLPDVDRVIYRDAVEHFGSGRITQGRVRESFGGRKPGPRRG